MNCKLIGAIGHALGSVAVRDKTLRIAPSRSKPAALIFILLAVLIGDVRAEDAAADRWGFDTSAMDKTAKPGDDFFRYANGSWLDRAVVPPDKSIVGVWDDVRDRTAAQVRSILEDAATNVEADPTTVKGKVGAFFRSFMNEGRVELLGIAPIEAELDAIRTATTSTEIAALMGQSPGGFFGTLFRLSIRPDKSDPTRYRVYVTQWGLGLPDRDYYFKDDFAAQRNAYERYVAALLELIGWPDSRAAASRVVRFETRVAEASWTKVQQRDPLATYNPMTVVDLTILAPGFPWREFLSGAGLGAVDDVVVAEKSAFPLLAAIFADTALDTLQAHLAFSVADAAASYLPMPFVEANFELRDRTLSGQQAERPRWWRGTRAVAGGNIGKVIIPGDRREVFGNMGWAVGQLYVDAHFPPSTQRAIDALVANLVAAYRHRLQALDWMSAQTKQEALRKLDTYTVKVGAPKQWRDYTALVIRDDDLIGNVRRAATHNWAHFVAELPQPVDKSEWFATPQTVDAYNGILRDIIFPAAILQAPFFDADADPAINYGAAGAIIGHELTHGFDDQGRRFDAQGTLRDWWQPADDRAFQARAGSLGVQFSGYRPIPDLAVNSTLTMGENIADLGGLTLALEAYRMSLDGRPPPIIGGFTGEQRVFLGWAQAWRGTYRNEEMRKRIASDPHSPPQFRVNGPVRNIDAWYKAFDVRPGDKLYLPPQQRVRIW